MLKLPINNGAIERHLPLPRDYIVMTKALGVRLQGENYLSQRAARTAGQKALRELLAVVSKDEWHTA
jgi:hypothetical protein